MQIFIPTRDRLQAQYTWDNLTPELREQAQLVCPPEEVDAHTAAGRRALARPPVHLSAVRQWLLETCEQDQPLIMLDDDLGFFRRKNPDAFNLEPVSRTPKLNKLFADLNSLVADQDYYHAGLSPRQMNNRHFPATVTHTTRINAVHCVNPAKLNQLGVRYDAVNMMEDYHVVLSLLEAGHDNAVIADGAWDQVKGSGAPGGFAHYRTKARQTEAALALYALHPGYVRVVEKEPKTGQGEMWGGTRTDVRVYWTKAFKGTPLTEVEPYTPPEPFYQTHSYRWDRETRTTANVEEAEAQETQNG